jgi:serine/threonine protein kinase
VQYRQYFVRSSGWYDDARNVFIAMEFVKHGDLQQYVGRPMPEAEMQLIVSQVLSGLSYMHNLNYAHRDLKPAVS